MKVSVLSSLITKGLQLSNMAIDYINLKGYKSIRDTHIELKPINILIGANGSGKSNFISFFEFLHHLYDRKLQAYIGLRGGQEKFLHQGQPISPDDTIGKQIQFKISFNNAVNGYRVVLDEGDDSLVVSEEYLLHKKEGSENIANFNKEANIKTDDSYRKRYIISHLKSYRKYHFHGTGKNSPFNKTSHIENDSYHLYSEGQNLAAFLFSIQQTTPKKYNRIVKTIQSIAPFFQDFYLEPNANGYIRLQWQSKTSPYLFGVNDLSDGTIRFIALTTLFLQPKLPSSIIIDEPELGLHPSAIAKLAGMVKSASSRGAQIIMATQSADLINHFNADDIITVDHINGSSTFKRLDEYSLGDLWQRNIISAGHPNIQ